MGNTTRCWMRDLLAVLLALGGLGFAVLLMIQGELISQVPLGGTLSPTEAQKAVKGIMIYFQGFGGAIFLSAIAYIMVGQDNNIRTTVEDAAKRK